ncbi:MAG TPA: virulence factor [Anaerolineales bacterium]|nr:virulence factor [Anaerolineales bacterium]
MKTTCEVVYWRDIPGQVRARVGRKRASRPLSDRFQQAIDEAAMRAGKTGSDAYLEEWRTSQSVEREGEPEAAAAELAQEIEKAYPPERLQKLAANGGMEGS